MRTTGSREDERLNAKDEGPSGTLAWVRANTRAQHPQLIVLPETIVVLDAASYPAFAKLFQSFARTTGATIVVGVDLKDG